MFDRLKGTWTWARRAVGRIVWCRRGTSAFEFALTYPAMMLMLLTLTETAFVYFRAVLLEGAVRETGRLVRTGQAQAADDPVGVFTAALCTEIGWLIPCDQLNYSVTAGADFRTLVLNDLFDPSGKPINTGFDAGASNQAVVVRVSHLWGFLNPHLALILGTGDSREMEISSTTVFKNEPFPPAAL